MRNHSILQRVLLYLANKYQFVTYGKTMQLIVKKDKEMKLKKQIK